MFYFLEQMPSGISTKVIVWKTMCLKADGFCIWVNHHSIDFFCKETPLPELLVILPCSVYVEHMQNYLSLRPILGRKIIC